MHSLVPTFLAEARLCVGDLDEPGSRRREAGQSRLIGTFCQRRRRWQEFAETPFVSLDTVKQHTFRVLQAGRELAQRRCDQGRRARAATRPA